MAIASRTQTLPLALTPVDSQTAARQALVEALQGLPGVQSASAGLILPIGGILIDRSVQVHGDASRIGEPATVGFNVVAPRFFATLGTPLLDGRDLSDRDLAGAAPVALVNRSFERRFFGGRSALGRLVTSAEVTYEIVGVVGDAKYQNLREDMISTMDVSWLQLPRAQQLQRQDQPSNYNYVMRAAVLYDTLVDRSLATERRSSERARWHRRFASPRRRTALLFRRAELSRRRPTVAPRN